MVDTTTAQDNPFAVPDEEFSSLDFSTLESNDQSEVIDDNEQTEQEETDSEEYGEVDAEESSEEASSGDESEDEEATAEADEEDSEETTEQDSSESEETEDKEETEETEETEEQDSSDIKQFFEKVTSPFKANGQEMQIKDADDVIRLMQMGANYNKKMAALKPALKVSKMLERNKLLDEERISFLIDLDKKDPAAIKKLLKDSNIDPMDLDLEEGDSYKLSKKYSVDDKEIALDNVIEEIKDTPTYAKTLDIVSNQWDDQSRNIVANEPELLRVINDHMNNGIYKVISTEVEKERTLGRLNGVPVIQAYKQIGDAINARGGFDHLFNQGQNQEKPAQQAVKPVTNKVSQDERKAKRRAASPTKTAPSIANKQDFNPLALSDDEFMKQFDDRLL